MLYAFGKNYRHSSYIGMLLLIVFALCWGQQLGVWQGCTKASTLQHSSQLEAAAASDTSQHDCDKTSHLLKQNQPDSSAALLTILLLLLLPLIIDSRQQRPWLAPLWRPRRRPHLICCCFLE